MTQAELEEFIFLTSGQEDMMNREFRRPDEVVDRMLALRDMGEVDPSVNTWTSRMTRAPMAEGAGPQEAAGIAWDEPFGGDAQLQVRQPVGLLPTTSSPGVDRIGADSSRVEAPVSALFSGMGGRRVPVPPVPFTQLMTWGSTAGPAEGKEDQDLIGMGVAHHSAPEEEEEPPTAASSPQAASRPRSPPERASERVNEDERQEDDEPRREGSESGSAGWAPQQTAGIGSAENRDRDGREPRRGSSPRAHTPTPSPPPPPPSVPREPSRRGSEDGSRRQQERDRSVGGGSFLPPLAPQRPTATVFDLTSQAGTQVTRNGTAESRAVGTGADIAARFRQPSAWLATLNKQKALHDAARRGESPLQPPVPSSPSQSHGCNTPQTPPPATRGSQLPPRHSSTPSSPSYADHHRAGSTTQDRHGGSSGSNRRYGEPAPSPSALHRSSRVSAPNVRDDRRQYGGVSPAPPTPFSPLTRQVAASDQARGGGWDEHERARDYRDRRENRDSRDDRGRDSGHRQPCRPDRDPRDGDRERSGRDRDYYDHDRQAPRRDERGYGESGRRDMRDEGDRRRDLSRNHRLYEQMARAERAEIIGAMDSAGLEVDLSLSTADLSDALDRHTNQSVIYRKRFQTRGVFQTGVMLIDLIANQFAPFLGLQQWGENLIAKLNEKEWDSLWEEIYRKFYKKGPPNPYMTLGLAVITSLVVHIGSNKFGEVTKTNSIFDMLGKMSGPVKSMLGLGSGAAPALRPTAPPQRPPVPAAPSTGTGEPQQTPQPAPTGRRPIGAPK